MEKDRILKFYIPTEPLNESMVLHFVNDLSVKVMCLLVVSTFNSLCYKLYIQMSCFDFSNDLKNRVLLLVDWYDTIFFEFQYKVHIFFVEIDWFFYLVIYILTGPLHEALNFPYEYWRYQGCRFLGEDVSTFNDPPQSQLNSNFMFSVEIPDFDHPNTLVKVSYGN